MKLIFEFGGIFRIVVWNKGGVPETKGVDSWFWNMEYTALALNIKPYGDSSIAFNSVSSHPQPWSVNKHFFTTDQYDKLLKTFKVKGFEQL